MPPAGPAPRDLPPLAALARAAAATGSRRDADALHRAIVALSDATGWDVYEHGDDWVLAAPGSEIDDELGITSPEEVLRVSPVSGAVEWETVPAPIDRLAEAISWSAPGRALPGVEGAESFADAIARALAAVDAAPAHARTAALADAWTLLDHPLAWDLAEDARDADSDDEDDADADADDDDPDLDWLPGERGEPADEDAPPREDAAPEADPVEEAARPLLAAALAAGPALLDAIAERPIPARTQREHHYVELVDANREAGHRIPPRALAAVAACRRADGALDAWEASYQVLARVADTQREDVQRILDTIDPLDETEEHVWVRTLLEETAQSWARDEAQRRSRANENAGRWQEASLYAEALAGHPSPEAAAYLAEFMQRYRRDGPGDKTQAWRELVDAAKLARGEALFTAEEEAAMRRMRG